MKKTFPLSDRAAARVGPRDHKPRGSAAWCWQTIEVLKLCYERLETNWSQVEDYLRDIEEVAAWNTVPPGRPYGSLEALLRAELGKDEVEFRHEVADAKLLGRHGGDRRSEQAKEQVRNTHLKGDGSVARTLARLDRDAPALAARVRSGELTAHAAAIEAGFRRPTVTIRLDSAAAAIATLLKRFTREELRRALDEVP